MAEPTLTLASSTASRPGGLRISRLLWCLRYPMWPVLYTVALALAILGAGLFHPGLWIPAALLLVWNLLYWRRIREHFLWGDANPGLVVGTFPILIAVRTDLSVGEGSYPVVKVIRERPSRRWAVPLQIGERVATVALYRDHVDEDKPYWEDFDPRPVEPLVARIEDARRLRDSFERKAWDMLERGIEQLPAVRVGLHRIDRDSSDWAEVRTRRVT